jgi:hypothetical protein
MFFSIDAIGIRGKYDSRKATKGNSNQSNDIDCAKKE